MTNRLFNPFNYVAGAKSLAIGVAGLLLTIVLSWSKGIYYPDVLSIKEGYNFPLWNVAAQVLGNWLVWSSVLYAAALLFSKSSVRAIDVFGTQAFARLPILLMTIAMNTELSAKVAQYAMSVYMKQGEAVSVTQGEINLMAALSLVALLLIAWMFVLSVNAFKVSANIKGAKLTVIYIVCLVLATVVSRVLFKLLLTPNI